MVNDPQVIVYFSYSNLELNSLHRVLWKFCVHHASFSHCCIDFMTTMKTYLFEKCYREVPNKNIMEMEQEMDVFDIYKEIRLFTAQLMEEEFDSDDCPDEIRCLHNVLLFIIGEHGKFFWFRLKSIDRINDPVVGHCQARMSELYSNLSIFEHYFGLVMKNA